MNGLNLNFSRPCSDTVLPPVRGQLEDSSSLNGTDFFFFFFPIVLFVLNVFFFLHLYHLSCDGLDIDSLDSLESVTNKYSVFKFVGLFLFACPSG